MGEYNLKNLFIKKKKKLKNARKRILKKRRKSLRRTRNLVSRQDGTKWLPMYLSNKAKSQVKKIQTACVRL